MVRCLSKSTNSLHSCTLAKLHTWQDHFVYDKNFKDPYVVPPQMLEVLNKPKIFQLRFGAYRSALNIYDIYVGNVLDDCSEETTIKLTKQAEAGPSNTLRTIIAVDTTSITPPTPAITTPFNADPPQITSDSSS
jgi:replication factor A1